MAIVKMRDLLRDPSTVFEALEKDDEPILLTRHGTPVAMLTRVSPTQATQAAMAALPEFVERRHFADQAMREGRTISSAELLERLASDEEGGQGSGVVSSVGAGDPTHTGWERAEEVPEDVLESVTLLFGPGFAEELADDLRERVAAATLPVVEAVLAGEGAKDGESKGKLAERVQELNGELFRDLLGPIYRSKLGMMDEATSTWHGQTIRDPANAYRTVIAEVVSALGTCVREVNEAAVEFEFTRGGLDLPTYEAFVSGMSMRGRIDRLGRLPSLTPEFEAGGVPVDSEAGLAHDAPA